MNMPAVAARFFEHRSDFQSAALDAIGLAEAELLMFDPSYADWPANAPAFEDALEAFLARSTRAAIRMVITEVDRINRDYPRLARFLRRHVHRAECRATPEQYVGLSETMLIADRASALRRPVASRYNGVLRTLDMEYAGAQRDRFDELWEAAHERYTPTPLGL